MLLELLQGKREVISTYDAQIYSRAAKILAREKIKFKTKVTNTGSGNRSRGALASIGEKVDCEIQYQIFVDKNNFESAVHCLKVSN